MSHFIVQKSSLKGQIAIPPSKSQTFRAILLASLARGSSCVKNFLVSPDTEWLVKACQELGADIEYSPQEMRIKGVSGRVRAPSDVIYAGNSGIILRFLGAVAALSEGETVISGDESLSSQRPIQPLLDGLNQLGGSCVSLRHNGFAPIRVKGQLKSGFVKISGEDSQFVSALLIASAHLNGVTDISVMNPGEKPWVELTLEWLNRLGIRIKNDNYERFQVEGRIYDGFEYSVPGDLSSLAFPLAAALITDSEIVINNVNMDDSQGDKKLVQHVQKMGARLEIDAENQRLYVKKGTRLEGASFDINDCIDTLPILSVLGCYAEGGMKISGAKVARTKECDRIKVMAEELRKMGASIYEEEDGLIVQKSHLKGASLNAHGDHRVAMALTVASLGSEGDSYIASTKCIEKTFPDFFTHFVNLGANLQKREI